MSHRSSPSPADGSADYRRSAADDALTSDNATGATLFGCQYPECLLLEDFALTVTPSRSVTFTALFCDVHARECIFRKPADADVTVLAVS